ncbi:hypothetical protein HNQ75_001751 [Rhizobium flavum]|uniref:SOS response-associated peptidase n=1 Tax=Pseudorhizobium flavum TaxID=1335061 RepID=A0A7W9YWM4_9HYPH|nr:hypothetical protein [Pseudorhizobium flavum]MBB6179783.1 hypothetical protein [Pseudorhizobium flavum]CAD6596837.1 SOS response-associated peptidase [Pseudorhizobium flavum]
MCNDYEQHIRYAEYLRALEEQGLAAPAHQARRICSRRMTTRISDLKPVMRSEGEGMVALSPMAFPEAIG